MVLTNDGKERTTELTVDNGFYDNMDFGDDNTPANASQTGVLNQIATTPTTQTQSFDVIKVEARLSSVLGVGDSVKEIDLNDGTQAAIRDVWPELPHTGLEEYNFRIYEKTSE